jgi:PIN like domain
VGALKSSVGRFLCDRNLGKRVPTALAENGWEIERHDDHFDHNTSDDVILRTIAERGWIFLTQDKKIRTRGPERRILLDYGVRTVSVASTANLSATATVETLLAAAAKLFRAIRAEAGPFIIAIYKDGSIRRLDLSDAEEQVRAFRRGRGLS